jgi:hypothetical protein
MDISFFFLEYAGELHIIVLIVEKMDISFKMHCSDLIFLHNQTTYAYDIVMFQETDNVVKAINTNGKEGEGWWGGNFEVANANSV